MFELPHRLGRYELLELLAVGGMAEVYRARIPLPVEATEKQLVVKRILPQLAQNREFINMFIDEARITVPLAHGNIVQVYELGKEGNEYFLVMEYVRGRNLETVLERLLQQGERLPLEMAAYIGYEVARGLAYAHRFRDADDRPAGIVHRDISPQNILVGFQGEVKITDFGIARARSRIRSTSQGIIRGKACYLSPEQAECRELDGRSDLFSLGVVLYEAIAGRRPFEGPDEVATLELVRRAEPTPLRVHREEITPELENIVHRALRRDPAERFNDAGQMQAALAGELQRLAPGFTSLALADWMRQHFAGEIEREKVERRSRDQLPPAGAGRGFAPTVNIRADAAPVRRPARRWLLRSAVFLVPLLFAAYAWWRYVGPPEQIDAGHDDDAAMAVDAGSSVSGADGTDDADDGQASDAHPTADEDAGTGDFPGGDRPPVRLGRLDINSRPWARVWIDGHPLKGETPFFKVPVPPGRHRLRFYNPELKMEKMLEVDIEPGGYRLVTVELDAP